MIFYLLNKAQKTVKLLNNDETIESTLDEAINTARELKFSLPLQKRLESNIFYVLIPARSGDDFLMFKIISENVESDRVTYDAVEAAYDELKSYKYIQDIRPQNTTAGQMLKRVLNGTRWSVGYVDDDASAKSTTFYYITVLEAIQKIVDLYKLEVTFTVKLDPVTQQISSRDVNLYLQQGRRTGKRFEYGSNLLTVTREEDSQDLVTALVGRGKGIQVSGQDTEDTSDDGYGRRITFADIEWRKSGGAPVDKPKGQEYIEDPKATAAYGFDNGKPRIGLIVFEDIEDPNLLINATWVALQDAKRPKVSFKANVTDVGDLQLGDTIAIIRHDLKIEYFTRVYKVHHNLKDEKQNTVEMGDDFSSRSITSQVSKAIQSIETATHAVTIAAIAANGKNHNFYSTTKPDIASEGDNLYLNLGNGETELWVWHHGQWEFVQSTVDLHKVQKQVEEAQSGLEDAKNQIKENLEKADNDIAELNSTLTNKINNQNSIINTDLVPQITEINSQVNQQKDTVKTIRGEVTEQGKNLSQLTQDVNGISIDMGNLKGEVNQTKVTLNGLESTLGNAQGDLTQLKASAGNVQITLSNFDKKLNDFAIGTQNILLSTGSFVDYQTQGKTRVANGISGSEDMIPNHSEIDSCAVLNDENDAIYSNQQVKLEKGKTYWFGLYFGTDTTEDVPFKTISLLSTNISDGVIDNWQTIDSQSQSFWGDGILNWQWHVYKIIGDGKIHFQFRIEPKNKGMIGSCYIGGYTLVQSDAAPTSHSNNPNDDNSKIDEVITQINQNAGSINSIVGRVTDLENKKSPSYSEYSNLNQTVKGLQSTVSSNYGNLQSQINQTSGNINSIVGKVNNLETKTGIQMINKDIDANDFTTSGTYFVESTNSKNVPLTNWFYLEVEKFSDNRIIQTWQSDNNPSNRFIRTYTGNWTQWERSASYSEYSSLNQTVKGLQSTVSSNYGNLQSQISQTAGTIRSEVTNKVNGLQSQITQTSNNLNFMVGDLSNICRNPDFSNGSTEGWSGIRSSNGDPQSVTKYYASQNSRDGFYGNWFPVSEGDKYYFSIFAWQNKSTQAFGLGLSLKMEDGSTQWQNGIRINPSEGYKTKTGNITIPPNAVEARIWTQINSYSDYGNWYFTNVIVKRNDSLAQINMSAGTTLIQNDKIYMDASSTVFSGKAFIPNAAITNISADKINAGTLDAGKINVINLNASNITTGTINGANLKIDLNNGEILFQKGRIASSNGYLNIDIDSGRMSVTNYNNEGVYFQDGKLILDDRGFGSLITNSPKYGIIQRSNQFFTNNAYGMEIKSPSGVSLKTSNYDGFGDDGASLDITKNGAAISVDQKGEALVSAGGLVALAGGRSFKTNDSAPMDTRPHIWVGNSEPFKNTVGSRIEIEADYVNLPSAYWRTTSKASNVVISDMGAIMRSTSASKYKTNIQRSHSTDYGNQLINLPIATWVDKAEMERYQDGIISKKPGRNFGMIAEDLEEAGLNLLVTHDSDGNVEGIEYERIGVALIPVIKQLKEEITNLEKKINE